MKKLETILHIVKKYWYLIVILFLIISSLVIGTGDAARLSKFNKIFTDVVESYKNYFKDFKDAEKKEEQANDKAKENLDKNLEEINSKSETELKAIELSRQELIDELSKKSPVELAKLLKEEFKL